jgi:hypothetical protein
MATVQATICMAALKEKGLSSGRKNRNVNQRTTVEVEFSLEMESENDAFVEE